MFGRLLSACLLSILAATSSQSRAEDPRAVRTLRDSLLAVDSAFAFPAEVLLSPDEKDADRYLARLRTMYLRRFASEPDRPYRTPFVASRALVRQTRLHQALRRMPKGGMLHVHATSTGRAAWIVDRALEMPDCQVYWGETNETNVHGQLGVFPDGPAPRGWVRISDLKATHPDLRGELLELITLGPEDLGTTDPWREFESIFWRIDGFTSYRPVFVDYYRDAFETLAEDGVQFLELRTSLDPIVTETGERIAGAALLDLYRGIVEKVRRNYPGFDLAIIVTGYRQDAPSAVREKMDLERTLAASSPDLVVGFDIVGEEDRGKSTASYSEVLAEPPPVPLFLHGGESLSLSNTNLRDAWLLGSERIGHGFSLVHSWDLEPRVRESGTVLEICPISNQSLGYVPDLRLHPARGLLLRGMQGVLSSDDPEMFGSEGLTDDFWEAYVAWGLDLANLKQLAWTSVVRSALPESRKARQLEVFEERWDRFVRGLVRASIVEPVLPEDLEPPTAPPVPAKRRRS